VVCSSLTKKGGFSLCFLVEKVVVGGFGECMVHYASALCQLVRW
jgi:hypothetical protein